MSSLTFLIVVAALVAANLTARIAVATGHLPKLPASPHEA